MTRNDGQKLHDSFRPQLDAGEVVTLDFSGTTTFVSAFFNTAIGQLLQSYTKDQLSKKLVIRNVPNAAVGPLQKAIDTANRYYRDPAYRAALEQVLTEQSELV